MPITFALPPGASEPREPHAAQPAGWSDNPESDLWTAVDTAQRTLDHIGHSLDRGQCRDGAAYRVDPARVEAIERAATALNTATAIYRARRET